MKKAILLIAVVAFTVTSCKFHDSKKFEKKVVFENQNWKRFDKLTFNMQVTPKDTLDFNMIFTYSKKKFNYKLFPINVTFYTPNEEVRSRDHRYNFYNYKTNKWKGEGTGDTLSYKLNVRKGMTFNKAGNLKVVIENKNPRTDNPGIISLELLVDKTKKK